MKFKYYIIFTILFTIVVGVLVYSLDSSSYTISILGRSHPLNLPVAVWIVIIVLIFFIFSLIFFLGEWMSGLIAERNYKSDFEKLIAQIISQNTKNKLLVQSYKSHYFRLLSKILARFFLKADLASPNSSYAKLDKLFEVYCQIDLGIEQDIKKIDLSDENEFFIKNTQNKIHKDLKFALEFLKGDFLNINLKKYAFLEIIQRGNDKEIHKAIELTRNFLDKEMLKVLFTAYSQNRFNCSEENLAQMCKNIALTQEDYLKLATECKPFLSPDIWLKLFEIIADTDENAEKSYLYVMLELEMIDSAYERLSMHSKGEFLIVNAYLDLKKSGKNYPIDIFFKTNKILHSENKLK